MAINRVPGATDFGSSSSNKYTPVLYAMELLEKFYKSTVFSDIANTRYQGQISKQGDKVIIRTRPDVTIFDYVKGMNLRDKRQSPDSPNIELTIDYAKAYSLNIDDIDDLQTDINLMEEWAYDGGQQLGIQIDRSILNSMYTSAHASNKGATAGAVSGSYVMGVTGTPIQVTTSNALDLIMDADAILTEQDVPITDRWIVLPGWYCNLLQKGDLQRADVAGYNTGGDINQMIRNGKLGTLSNFTVYSSNNYVPVADSTHSCYNIVFGQKSALTFASQLVKNRTFPDPDSFATIMDGLQVYGWSVPKPEALGVLYAYK
jgi:hypothetical protein